jgi:polysaccharide export outer membrane protein
MYWSSKTVRSLKSFATCCLLIVCTSGCSSLGGGLGQFPLLSKTKQYSAAAPLPSGLPNELAKSEIRDYFVEPGDRILIEPVNIESEIGSLGDQKIQVDGSVDLGKFGRVRVAGMSVEEIEQAVESQIAIYGKPESINVQLVESNAAEVYVLGEVGSPAAYPIEGHEHVLDAILRAGGLTSKASPCNLVLVRPTAPDSCRVVLPVCYRQITQLGDVTTNYQLQPGDRIVVGSRSFWEELAFCKRGKECDRCSRSCCVECQPSNVQYQNRFANGHQPFKLPARQADQKGSDDTGSSQSDKKNSYYLPNKPIEPDSKPKPKSDEDLFLPSLQSDGTRK